jgi:hypothetical protein
MSDFSYFCCRLIVDKQLKIMVNLYAPTSVLFCYTVGSVQAEAAAVLHCV